MNSQTPAKDPFAQLSEDLAAGIEMDIQSIRDEISPARRDTGLRLGEPFRSAMPERKPAPIATAAPQGATGGTGPDRPAQPAAAAPDATEAAPEADKGAVVAAAAPSGSDVEKFLANGSILHDKQRRKILALESAYEFDRVKLIDDYRVKLRDLEHEASEALRDFDIKQQAAIDDAKKILAALSAMRGG